MLDEVQQTLTHTVVHPTSGVRFADGSDAALHDQIRAYLSSELRPVLQRTSQCLEKARRTDHCVTEHGVHGGLIGVSLPIPQLFVRSPLRHTSVSSAIEMEIHHSHSFAYDTFLRQYVLPSQIAHLAEAHENALIYAVIEAKASYGDVFRDHGWITFEPEYELVLSREQTGVRYDRNTTWLKRPQ